MHCTTTLLVTSGGETRWWGGKGFNSIAVCRNYGEPAKYIFRSARSITTIVSIEADESCMTLEIVGTHVKDEQEE